MSTRRRFPEPLGDQSYDRLVLRLLDATELRIFSLSGKPLPSLNTLRRVRLTMRVVSSKSVLKAIVTSALAIAIAIADPRAALAHAVLVRSTPTANSAIAAGEVEVTLAFNSRVDPVRSSLSLLGPDGKVTRITIGPPSSPEILSGKMSVVAKGTYKLRWQALSSDGHITRGEIPFSVR
jgi:methionine-rich copper-binding protein CopC